MPIKLKIKTGDLVVAIAGKDRGRSGEVLKVFPKESRLLVKGINLAQKHIKASRENPGKIEPREASIHISNVAILDSKTLKPTKVGFRYLEDGTKKRFARRSNEFIDK
jgi:large subunit ribosomal protein L24